MTKFLHPHEWTDASGHVLVLRFADKDGKSYNGFQHPMTVGDVVTAPDWSTRAECGCGIHGWPWGIGIGEGKDPDWSELWQVYAVNPKDGIVSLDGKIKFRTGRLAYMGDWQGAVNFLLPGQIAWTQQAKSATGYGSASSATGNSSASSATGYRSASSATGDGSASSATGDGSASSATGYGSASSATGDRSASSATGYRSASSATGYRSASSATGDGSASSATGDRSASSATGACSASSATGDCSAAIVTGLNGHAKAGKYGCIALAWWNPKVNEYEMRCARIGNGQDDLLKPDTWYMLDDKTGEFVRADQ